MTLQKIIFTPLILASSFLSATVAAQTERDTGAEKENKPSSLYVSVSGGVNLQSNNRFEGVQALAAGVSGMVGAPAVVRVNYDTGPAVRAAIGYRWKKGFIKWLKPRTEIEVSRTRAGIQNGSFNAGNQVFSGSLNTTTVKIGLASDIRWSETQTVVPFLSSGYGIAIVDPNIQYFPVASLGGPTFQVSGRRTRFARHNGIGLSYTGINGLDLYAEGRYSQISGANFERRFIANDGFSASVRDKTRAFEVTAGTRLRF